MCYFENFQLYPLFGSNVSGLWSERQLYFKDLSFGLVIKERIIRIWCVLAFTMKGFKWIKSCGRLVGELLGVLSMNPGLCEIRLSGWNWLGSCTYVTNGPVVRLVWFVLSMNPGFVNILTNFIFIFIFVWLHLLFFAG